MIFAFSGAHRTGKSTLARLTAERYGIPFVETTTAGLTAELGIDLSGTILFEDRLRYQDAVLTRLLDTLCDGHRTHDTFVTDRTPLDAAAYLLADCINTAGSDADHRAVLDYVRKCQGWSRALFKSVVLVPPALPLVAAENKGAANPAYQMHHHLLLRGLLAEDHDQEVDWQELPVKTVDLDGRMAFVDWVLARFDMSPATQALAA